MKYLCSRRTFSERVLRTGIYAVLCIISGFKITEELRVDANGFPSQIPTVLRSTRQSAAGVFRGEPLRVWTPASFEGP